MSNAILTLDDLGHDVLLLVLSHLDDPQDVAHYAKSSRNSREVAQLSELPRTVRYLNAQRTNRFRGFRRDGQHDAADFVHNDARPAMVMRNQNAFQKAAAHGLLLVHKWGENHHYVKSNRHSS